jgi:hypothetical protein
MCIDLQEEAAKSFAKSLVLNTTLRTSKDLPLNSVRNSVVDHLWHMTKSMETVFRYKEILKTDCWNSLSRIKT